MQGDAADRRYMAAAIRLSRRHLGQTGTNPSVGTLIVKDGVIVGRGVTAIGGRPHAETQALAEAGNRARGATAYVTLEPCAHHGRTPPCADALVAAGIARVVGAAADPDPRVAGRGYAILRDAGIVVTENVGADAAADLMAGYLIRSLRKRPEVVLKLAISADGMIGRSGEGQVAITGAVARAQVHRMRAETDAILIGVGTAMADDPELTVRLPGMADRSPERIVLDPLARMPVSLKLVATARQVPTRVAIGPEAPADRVAALRNEGVGIIASETVNGRVALPELLDDLAARGISTLMVEGGAAVAGSFLAEGLVDRLVRFMSPVTIGQGGIAAPAAALGTPAGMIRRAAWRFGDDVCEEWACSPAS